MNTQDLTNIDKSLGLMGQFNKINKNTGTSIQKMRTEVIFTDGEFHAKVKVLGAVLWAVSARCEPCIKFYVSKAKELGVNETELGEFLAIAATMGGCVGEMWALKAYQAFKEGSPNDENCCD